jgi:prefoldin subunit 5
MPPERELEWLKNQTQFLNQQIEYIAARIKELEEK